MYAVGSTTLPRCCLLLQGPITLDNYTARMEVSWVAQELDRARNIRPGFRSVKHHYGPVDLYTMHVPKQLHVSAQCMTAEVVHYAAPGQTTDMLTGGRGTAQQARGLKGCQVS
jgi:hypothetical protein